MKKILSTMTVLACLAGAANAAPYVLPENQPGALTAYDWTPVYGIDALYAIGDEDTVPDMWGARASFSLYSQQRASVRHQFSLNVAYETGDKKDHGIKTDMHLMPITLGYNVHLAVTDEVAFYLGGKAGYTIGEAEFKTPGDKETIDTDGFNFTVGAGLHIQCSDAVYVRLGYEFGRTYVDKNDVKDNFGQHIISLGVGCQF